MAQNGQKITIDLLVVPANTLISCNPDIAAALGVSKSRLKRDHNLLADYLNDCCSQAQVYVKSEVPEGKEPALIVVPNCIKGNFLVVPDKKQPGGYVALIYRDLRLEQEGGQQREVYWMTRLPPRTNLDVASSAQQQSERLLGP